MLAWQDEHVRLSDHVDGTAYVVSLIEQRIEAERVALERGRAPKGPEVHHVPDAEKGKVLSRRSMRYLASIQFASLGAVIVGVGMDSSRIGMRKRMKILLSLPGKGASWLPTKAFLINKRLRSILFRGLERVVTHLGYKVGWGGVPPREVPPKSLPTGWFGVGELDPRGGDLGLWGGVPQQGPVGRSPPAGTL